MKISFKFCHFREMYSCLSSSHRKTQCVVNNFYSFLVYLSESLSWTFQNWSRVFYIIKRTCRWTFLNKREVFSRFFGKSNIFKYISTCQTRSYDFWIMNAMCTFMYLFVVYFSFDHIFSAGIHRYVNYFDIQVLMMVTKTETLTSTLHHNIFTYLDYVFSATFILLNFNPYLLS